MQAISGDIKAGARLLGSVPTETKVAGKKVSVLTAIAFIAAVSFLTSCPMRAWSSLSRCAAVLKAWQILAGQYGSNISYVEGIYRRSHQSDLILESCLV